MKKMSLLLGCAAFLLAAACTPLTRTQMDFGASYNMAKYNQIQNPQAGKDAQPVQGLDGKAAEKAVEKYRNDFDKPAPQPAFSLTINGK